MAGRHTSCSCCLPLLLSFQKASESSSALFSRTARPEESVGAVSSAADASAASALSCCSAGAAAIAGAWWLPPCCLLQIVCSLLLAYRH